MSRLTHRYLNKVTKDGYIVLKTEDNNDQVFLVVEEGGANPVELQLKSTDVKERGDTFMRSAPGGGKGVVAMRTK